MLALLCNESKWLSISNVPGATSCSVYFKKGSGTERTLSFIGISSLVLFTACGFDETDCLNDLSFYDKKALGG